MRKCLLPAVGFTLCLAAFALPTLSFAKTINVYEEPKEKSDLVEKLDLSKGVIPIYTPKGSSWMKVADPRNGNVGWVKSKEIKMLSNTQPTLSYSQSVMGADNNPVTYRYIQIGNSSMSPAEKAAMMKQMEAQQAYMQKSMQRMMMDMNHYFKSDMSTMNHPFVFPYMMPVMIVPVEKNMMMQKNKKVAQHMATSTPQKLATKQSFAKKIEPTSKSTDANDNDSDDSDEADHANQK